LLTGCCTDCPTLPDLPTIRYVTADGSGPYKTIGAAVAAAGDGDIVALADGVYRGPGNRDIEFESKAITLCSASGRAEACTVDCEGTEEDHHRAFYFHDDEDASTIVQDLTVVNGNASYGGGGILCEHGSSPTLRRLVVSHCLAEWYGGGLYAASRSRAVIEDCCFVSNWGWWGGGVSSFGAAPRIRRCSFENNEGGGGGGLFVRDANAGEALIEGCAFTGNYATAGGAMFFQDVQPQVSDCSCTGNEGVFGGAIDCEEASPVFVRCTSFCDGIDGLSQGCSVICSGERPVFISCTLARGRGNVDAALVELAGCDAHFEKCILSFCEDGPALEWHAVESKPVFSCCDISGNGGGDWTGSIEDQAGVRGNFSADPLFCDPEGGSLYLQTTSPCRPSASDCGLVGALPVGCM
jgi:hypothetical protein